MNNISIHISLDFLQTNYKPEHLFGQSKRTNNHLFDTAYYNTNPAR